MDVTKSDTKPVYQHRITIIVAYLVLLSAAELITAYAPGHGVVYAEYGIAVHAFILFLLLFHSAVIAPRDPEFSQLLVVLILAPLIRILSLAMPFRYLSYIVWFAIISIPVYLAIFTCMYLQGMRPDDIALVPPRPRYLPLELGMIICAVPVGIAEYQILKPGAIIEPQLEALLVPALIMIVCTGFLEELAFRGLMQYHATRTMGFAGIVLISALFGLLHIGNLTILDVLLAGRIGFVFALVVRKTGSIYGVSIAHGVINIVLFLVAPAFF